jgi:hypothetical protein
MPLMEGLPICGSILLENPNSLPAKVLFTSNIIYRYATGCVFLLALLSLCALSTLSCAFRMPLMHGLAGVVQFAEKP